MKRLLLAGIAVLATLSSAAAATFDTYHKPQSPYGAIVMRGAIEEGDDSRFQTAFSVLSREGAQLRWLELNSPGGYVAPAEQIAQLTHKLTGVHTIVRQGDSCASACALIFYSAPERALIAGGRIGLHRASGQFGENFMTRSTSVDLAELYSSYGASASTIGKMVTTPPGGITWLTDGSTGDFSFYTSEADLPPAPAVAPVAPTFTLGGESYPLATPPAPAAAPTDPVAPVAPVSIPVAPPTTTPAAAPTPAPVSAAFAQGLADRAAWENWLNPLAAGRYREGAEYWAEHRSDKPQPSCASFIGGDDSFHQGCLAAKVRLDQSDRERHASADYRAGWNSFNG